MTQITLDARLDHGAAPALHETLSSLNDDVTLNADQVTHLGAMCVQVLIVAARRVRASGHKFSILGFSEKVEAQLAAMGLSSKMIMEGV